MLPSALLFPAGHSPLCSEGSSCREAVVAHNGKFFVTFGHCGFNSPTNNGSGYASEARARAAIRMYGSRRKEAVR